MQQMINPEDLNRVFQIVLSKVAEIDLRAEQILQTTQDIGVAGEAHLIRDCVLVIGSFIEPLTSPDKTN